MPTGGLPFPERIWRGWGRGWEGRREGSLWSGYKINKYINFLKKENRVRSWRLL